MWWTLGLAVPRLGLTTCLYFCVVDIGDDIIFVLCLGLTTCLYLYVVDIGAGHTSVLGAWWTLGLTVPRVGLATCLYLYVVDIGVGGTEIGADHMSVLVCGGHWG